MDTFNFSFFDDKPQESEKDAEDTSSSSTNAASNSEAQPDTNDDPFGFEAFDLDGSDKATKEDAAQSDALSLDMPAQPVAMSENDFDLSSLSEGFSLEEPKSADGFPNLTLDATPAPAASTSSTDTGLDDFRIDDDGASADFGDLDFASEDSSAMTVEANEALTLGAPDNFDTLETETLDNIEPIAEPNPPFDIDPLTEPEAPAAPEVATVLPPVTAGEIRASVEPAIFLEPQMKATPSEPETTTEESMTEVESEPQTEAREERPKAKAARFLTADDPYGEVAPPRERLRVAILGASGIGKNHARWFARHSCDVVSFLGSSDESVELTRSHLQAHMGFAGQGYSDLGRLLSETKPQAVCIASPSNLHYAQAIQCLESGIHVLCEKPLVYSATRTRRENMDGAKELLKSAARRQLVLGTQLQYGAATPILCRLAGVSPFEVGDFAMEIETTNPRAPREPKELWVELAPHPLAVAQYLAGEGAEIVLDTLQIMPSRSAYTSEVSARFGVRSVDGRLLMCRIIVRWFDKIVDNREPRRRFSFNGRVVQYSGVKSPDGTYIAQYVAPDGYISHYSDPVDYLIGNFVRTCWEEDELIFSSEQGVQNLDWLLSTVEKL